ncbi:cellulase family glycosylhydrolase [Lewinella sp. IMCC34191]|uniref:cellulase family glycosylhydrolase n=1 Tax=Lewinella sp. IMCC34191 TaxID=2259172 RepID=UPI000E27ED37|nr:cellulase family glycosylhydrolase [Lewinella sp. IMCC34191]
MTRFYLFLLCATLYSAANAQITPADAVAEMGRGINLGNTLEPPNEGDWNNGPAEEAYFDAYVEAGFTNVRIPVRWDEHAAETAPYAIDSEWMDRVEQVVDWGLERDLYITLNGHHEDWLKESYDDPASRARYDAIWVQIAERFQDKSEKLLFEIINEPFGMTVAEVDDLNERVLGIIRENNPTRLVIFGGNQYANAEELLAAAVPEDDYLIGYFHSYHPWSFAGEGVDTWGTSADYDALDDKFSRVNDWSVANDVPVHLSEFGAVRDADYNSRMRYYAAYVEAALRYGFAFSVWDDGGMFGILDRENNTWPEVKDILVNTYADSPTDLLLTPSSAEEILNPTVGLTWTNRSTDDSIHVERRIDDQPFDTVATLAATAEVYTDTSVMLDMEYTYRITTQRADGTILQSYPARAFVGTLPEEPAGGGIINYADNLDTAAMRFSGTPDGITYAVSDGVLTITGDGSSPNYQTFRYTLPDALRADAARSGNLLYIGARTLSGEAVNLRIDLIDENDIHTTNAGRTVSVSGTEFTDYLLDYTGGYQDGGYGGTSCTSEEAPCTVDGSRIVALAIYPEPVDGGFNETIEIDYLSFGVPLNADAGPTGVIDYRDDLDGATDQFVGQAAGLTYSVTDGVLEIVGDGSAMTYQTVLYNVRTADGDPPTADVLNSDNMLYVRARTASGDVANVRIDLIDQNNYHTTLAGRTASVEGSDYQIYQFDYEDGYRDGGYGGTTCTQETQPCPVDGQRISSLAIYVDPTTGGFNDTLFVDWLSFGSELSTSVTESPSLTGVKVYPNPARDQLNVDYHQLQAGEVHVELVDGLGRTVRQKQSGWQAAGRQTIPLEVVDLNAGIYYLLLRTAGERRFSSLPVIIR